MGDVLPPDTRPDPWGGKLHRVNRSYQAMCFECSDWLMEGEFVHAHFGGLVIIHCRCACGEEETVYDLHYKNKRADTGVRPLRRANAAHA